MNETSEWITEQLHAASAEDYGKDFEHLEVCVQNLLKRLSSWSRVELYIIRILTFHFCFWLPLVKLGVRWRSNRTLNIPPGNPPPSPGIWTVKGWIVQIPVPGPKLCSNEGLFV